MSMFTAEWHTAPARNPPGGPDFGRLIDALRLVQDRVAVSSPPPLLVTGVADQLEKVAALLAPYEVEESQRIAGRRWDLPGRGQTLVPPYSPISADSTHVIATVVFGSLYLGSGGAVHGGAIPLLFDEVMGKLANTGGRSRCRTAYLHITYRALVKVGAGIRIESRIDREEGRKRFLSAALYAADTLLAEATGLFVGARIES